MGYKYKPLKGIKKRMKVTKSGKIKHRSEKNSHLRSGRSSKTKRRLGRPSVLADGHAKNMREFLGLKGKRPKQAVHERAELVRAQEEAAVTAAE